MVSTHVLDISRGAPAARVPVQLDLLIMGQGWMEVGRGITDDDGRIASFGEPAAPGLYRLMFDVASFIPESFFPSIAVTFNIEDPQERYHVPLLISPFGYSTYRGR